jgi:hypothetical protein
LRCVRNLIFLSQWMDRLDENTVLSAFRDFRKLAPGTWGTGRIRGTAGNNTTSAMTDW